MLPWPLWAQRPPQPVNVPDVPQTSPRRRQRQKRWRRLWLLTSRVVRPGLARLEAGSLQVARNPALSHSRVSGRTEWESEETEVALRDGAPGRWKAAGERVSGQAEGGQLAQAAQLGRNRSLQSVLLEGQPGQIGEIPQFRRDTTYKLICANGQVAQVRQIPKGRGNLPSELVAVEFQRFQSGEPPESCRDRSA